MLLQTSLISVESATLYIPPWVRAPIGLCEGSDCVLAPTGLDPTKRWYEAVLTRFPTKVWADLWRIDLELADLPGLYSNLLAILSDLQIDVLTAESISLARREFHTVTLVIDCERYSSLRDKTTQERRLLPGMVLTGLRTTMLAELIPYLKFNDPSDPKLRIKRLGSYFQLAVTAGRPRPVTIALSRGTLPLPKNIVETVSSALGVRAKSRRGNGQLRATIVADSKERLLRVLFSLPDSGGVQTRIYFRSDPGALARIFDSLHRARFDVVRSHLRPGLYRPSAELKSQPKHEYSTLDLVLKSEECAEDTRLLTIISKALEADGLLDALGVVVTPGEVISLKQRRK
jgi:hypothetical protein